MRDHAGDHMDRMNCCFEISSYVKGHFSRAPIQ